jgi:hypothetical protein
VTANERALVDLYAGAIASPTGDADAPFSALVPLLNPDFAVFAFPGMILAHKPARIVEAHYLLFGGFDDRKMVMSRVFRTSSEQTIEWVMTATHAREWAGIGATHKPVAIKGLTLLWTKDDGSLTDLHVYFDVALLKAQLSGVGPKELLAIPPASVPTDTRQIFEQTADDQETVNADLVRSWHGALEDNKESAYLAALADGVEVYTLESASPARGKDEQKKYYRAAHKAIGQLDTMVSASWGIGQYVIVEYEIDGYQLAPFSWIPALASVPASMQLAHFDLVDICEVRDGKIQRVWRYDNPGQVHRALVSPTPRAIPTPTPTTTPTPPQTRTSTTTPARTP